MATQSLIVNLDTKEYLRANVFGDSSAKLDLLDTAVLPLALLALLASQFPGRLLKRAWGADRIAVVYEGAQDGYYEQAEEEWEDISLEVLLVLVRNRGIKATVFRREPLLTAMMLPQQAEALRQALRSSP